MCFGGGSSGPSADEMYKKQKVDFGELPSLRMTSDKKNKGPDKIKPEYRSVDAGAYKARSLINPMGTK